MANDGTVVQDKYYNGARTHRSLNKDEPVPRAVQAVGRILPTPILGGLHHQYGLILFPPGTGQGIVDFIGLTKTYKIAILVHGISLSLSATPNPIRQASARIPIFVIVSAP